jgi:PAS domain-containing protein
LLPCAEDALHLEAVKRQVIETGARTRAEGHVRHGGLTHPFDLIVQPDATSAGDVIGVTCAALDITERKRGGEALGSPATASASQSPFGVYAVDADFPVL